MENINLTNVLKGVKIGLIAFIICFGTLTVVSSVINYMFMDEINVLMNGTLRSAPNPTVGSLLLIISIMMNLSVFNNGGVLENGGLMHIGLLIFFTLPIIAFFIADRKNNRAKHFNLEDMLEYFVSSLVFALLLFIFSLIAKGPLLGVEVNFTNPMNIVMTTLILLIAQMFIGMNYNKQFNHGVEKTRHMLRILLIIGLLGGAVGLILVFGKVTGSVLMSIVATVLLLPNVAVYIMFTFMGASIEFGAQLQTLMGQFGLDLSFAVLPLYVRLIFIAAFFGLVFFNILKLEKEGFIKNVLYFGGSFAMISYVFAYSTTMNLGFVKSLLDVRFGINGWFAFLMPLCIVLLAGLLVWLIRLLLKEVKN